MRAKALAHHTVTDIRHNWRFGLGVFLPPALTGFALYAFIPPIETGNIASLLPFGGALLLYLSLSILAAIAWHRRILLGANTSVRQAINHPPLFRYLLGSLPPVAILVITTLPAHVVDLSKVFPYFFAIGLTLYFLLGPIAAPLWTAWIWCLLGAGLPAISLRRTGRGGQSFWRLMRAGLRHVLPITGAYLRFAVPLGLIGIALFRFKILYVSSVDENVLIPRLDESPSNPALLWLSDGLSLAWSIALTLITVALITRIYDALTAQPR